MTDATTTLKVLRSQIGDRDFAAEVEAHRQAIIEHRDIVGVPAPTAGSFVEQAITRVRNPPGPDDLVIDYEIIDDRPAPTAEEGKLAAITASRAQEEAEINALLPPLGLRRLVDMQINNAMAAIQAAKMEQRAPSPEDQKIVDGH